MTDVPTVFQLPGDKGRGIGLITSKPLTDQKIKLDTGDEK